LLSQHSKYSAMLSKIHSYRLLLKYTLTDCFFGDFAHWVVDGLSIFYIFGMSRLGIESQTMY